MLSGTRLVLGTKLMPLPATMVPTGLLLNLFSVLLCPVLLAAVLAGAAARVLRRVPPRRAPLVATGLAAARAAIFAFCWDLAALNAGRLFSGRSIA